MGHMKNQERCEKASLKEYIHQLKEGESLLIQREKDSDEKVWLSYKKENG